MAHCKPSTSFHPHAAGAWSFDAPYTVGGTSGPYSRQKPRDGFDGSTSGWNTSMKIQGESLRCHMAIGRTKTFFGSYLGKTWSRWWLGGSIALYLGMTQHILHGGASRRLLRLAAAKHRRCDGVLRESHQAEQCFIMCTCNKRMYNKYSISITCKIYTNIITERYIQREIYRCIITERSERHIQSIYIYIYMNIYIYIQIYVYI